MDVHFCVVIGLSCPEVDSAEPTKCHRTKKGEQKALFVIRCIVEIYIH